MRGIVSLLLVAALLACNGAGNPERGTLESTDSAVVNASGADVFPPPTGSQAGLAVGFDGTNHLVVWSDARGGTGQDLYGARVSKAGVVLGSAPIVISAASGDEVTAAVAFDGTNYLVVWQDSRGSTGRDVYGARVSPDGTVLDPGGIPISTALEHQVEPAVAFDGTSYLVVWEDRRGGFADVRGARVSPDGSVLATDLVVSGASLHQTQPAVACATRRMPRRVARRPRGRTRRVRRARGRDERRRSRGPADLARGEQPGAPRDRLGRDWLPRGLERHAVGDRRRVRHARQRVR